MGDFCMIYSWINTLRVLMISFHYILTDWIFSKVDLTLLFLIIKDKEYINFHLRGLIQWATINYLIRIFAEIYKNIFERKKIADFFYYTILNQ